MSDRLDFVYLPSRDVAADLKHLTGGLGAEVVFAIEAFGTGVAMVRLALDPPPLLFAGHLHGDQPILVSAKRRRQRDEPAPSRCAGTRSWTTSTLASRLAPRRRRGPLGPVLRVVSPFVRGEFGDPKSSGSGRSVPMAERVAVALRELRERSYYARDRDLVFCQPETGKPLDRSKLVRRFKQGVVRAEVHRITFHERRHTFGTRMAAAGTPMRTLQHWMGHADSKTTQISAHYQPSDQEADAVDRAFA